METMSPELTAYIATSIAVELSRNKSIEELNLIKSIATQVCSTINTIISQRIANIKK